jgi:hypothetical protein
MVLQVQGVQEKVVNGGIVNAVEERDAASGTRLALEPDDLQPAFLGMMLFNPR